MIKVTTLVLALMVTQCSFGAAQEKAKSEGKQYKCFQPAPRIPPWKCNNMYIDQNVRRDLKETGHSNNEKYIKLKKCEYLAHGIINEIGEINCELLKRSTINFVRHVTKGTAIYEKCMKQIGNSENFPHSYDRCFYESLGRIKKVPAEKCEEDDDQKE